MSCGPRRGVGLIALALAVAATACGHGTAPPTSGDATCYERPLPGLIPTGRVEAPGSVTSAPHLGEVLLHGDAVYASNSGDGVATFRLALDGGLELALAAPSGEVIPRCTSLALHLASNTLFCATPSGFHAAGHATVATLDISTPAEPTVRDGAALESDEVRFNDLALTEGRLWITAYGAGLLVSEVSATGNLSAPVPTGLVSHALEADSDGERLAVIGLGSGLAVFDVSAEPQLLGSAALDGPPLGVDLRGDRVAVALGSQGVRIWHVASQGELVLQHSLQPQCVADSVALAEHWVAIGCTTGVVTYDLTGPIPRLAGFQRADFVVMDVQVADEARLVASDWHAVVVFDVEVTGHAVLVDAEHARHITDGLDATVVVRNPGDIALDVTSRVLGSGTPVDRRTVAPGAKETFVVPSAVLDKVMKAPFFDATMTLTTREAGHLSSPSDAPPCVATKQPGIVVVLSRPRPDNASRPAVGDPTPILELGTGPLGGDEEARLTTPTTGERTRVMLYTDDCSAAWPKLQDISWLGEHAELPDTLDAAVAVDYGGAGSPAAGLWSLDGLDHAWASADVGTLVTEAGAELLGTWIFDDGVGLFADVLPGGADGNTDFVVTREGIVEAVERIYRGPWTLR